MAKNKIAQWAMMETYDHVVQPDMDTILSDTFELKGKWGSAFFGNNNPITVELGCGKGEYTLGLARRNPDRNFLGVDIKGHRMWRGATTAKEEGLENVGFVRTRVDFIDRFFEKGEVSEIWLTFSDPQKGKPRKRLTSPLFIDRYRKILSEDAVVNLKTDSDLLFEYTLEQIEENGYDCKFETWDLYGEGIHKLEPAHQDIMNIRTFYEQMWLEMGKKIKYCYFKV